MFEEIAHRDQLARVYGSAVEVKERY